MTKLEMIKETIACIMFGIFMTTMIFGCAISDKIDQTIIEERAE